MKKYLIICLIFFFTINAQSSSSKKIINHLKNINSLKFKFIQRIDNNNIEKVEILKECGITISKNPSVMGDTVKSVLEKI